MRFFFNTIGSTIVVLAMPIVLLAGCSQLRLPSSSARPTLVLRDSSAIKVTQAGQVVENLRIVVQNGPAIEVDNFKNVTIRNCYIEHQSGYGIKFSNADGLKIESVDIKHTGFPHERKLPDITHGNIDGSNSKSVTMSHVRASGGSAGIYLYKSSNARLTTLELKNFRGPFWKGQAIQLNESDDVVVDGFYVENEPAKSWVEDNISIYHSSSGIIRNGVIVGNDAPYGAAIQFEQRQGVDSDGLVDNVVAIGTMNAGFSTYPGFNVIFRRTFLRDNFCGDRGRGVPVSGGLGWQLGGLGNGAPSNSTNGRIEDSRYYNLCNNNLTYGNWSLADLKQENQRVETPATLKFPWE
jgi:hypothetical protein